MGFLNSQVAHPYSSNDTARVLMFYQPFDSSTRLHYVYVDIAFIWWDIADEVWGQIDWFQSLARYSGDNSFWFKTHWRRLTCVYVGDNAICCLLPAMHQEFGIDSFIYEKYYSILIVFISHSFCDIVISFLNVDPLSLIRSYDVLERNLGWL